MDAHHIVGAFAVVYGVKKINSGKHKTLRQYLGVFLSLQSNEKLRGIGYHINLNLNSQFLRNLNYSAALNDIYLFNVDLAFLIHFQRYWIILLS